MRPQPGPPPARLPSAPADTVRRFDESLLHGREFLFQQQPFSAVAAQDFDLGPVETGEDPVVTAARKFLDQVDSRSFDEALVSPRWSLYLKGRLAELRELGWAGSTRRWGLRKSPDEGGALIEVLLREGAKTTKALVYLGEAEGSWKVNDLQQFEVESLHPFDPLARAPGLLP